MLVLKKLTKTMYKLIDYQKKKPSVKKIVTPVTNPAKQEAIMANRRFQAGL